MPDSVDSSTPDMIVALGRSLLSSGYNVIDTRVELEAVAKARGLGSVEIGVFPTLIVVSDAAHPVARALPVSPSSLRYDQVMSVRHLVRLALDPAVSAQEILDQLRQVTRPLHRPLIADVGYLFAAAGFCILLGGGPVGAVLSALLAVIVLTWLRLLNGQRQRALATLLGAFVASVIATWLAQLFDLGISPLLVSLSAIALLIPSGGVVTATEELAAGEMVSGASRLLYSLLQILLLGVAIFAGSAVVGRGTPSSFVPGDPGPAMLVIVGLVLFSFGVATYTGTPRREGVIMLAIVAVTYGTQQAVSAVLSSVMSVGIAACVGLTVALLIQRLNLLGGPPALVTFTPAFWVLIPGALALGGVVVALAGGGQPDRTGEAFGLSVTAIVIGCLLGSIIAGAVKQRRPHAASVAPGQ